MKNLDRSAREHLEKRVAPIVAAAPQCQWHDKTIARVTEKNLPQIQNVASSNAVKRDVKTAMMQQQRDARSSTLLRRSDECAFLNSPPQSGGHQATAAIRIHLRMKTNSFCQRRRAADLLDRD